MKKCKRIALKRIQIVIVWLAFLAVFSFAAFRIEYHLFAGEARENLASQAKNISLLLPNIEQNDRFVKQSIGRTMPARMNALAVGLDKYEDIESALLFLEGFMNDSGLESLVIYDTAGSVIYGDRAFAEELKLNADDVDRYMTGGAKYVEDSQPDFNVWEIGLKEEMLQDSYDGSANIRNEKHVLSVRLKGENWIILMRQYPWQIMDLVLRAIYAAMMALLYSLVLMAICCLGRNNGQTEGEADEAKGEAHDTESPRNEKLSRVRNV